MFGIRTANFMMPSNYCRGTNERKPVSQHFSGSEGRRRRPETIDIGGQGGCLRSAEEDKNIRRIRDERPFALSTGTVRVWSACHTVEAIGVKARLRKKIRS